MKATVGADGLAVAPVLAPPVVHAVIAAGNRIAKMPYLYGGGHGKWEDRGYDCSGSVSYALHGGGLLETAMPSGGFMSWGDAGPGQWITIYAHGGHMYMVVAGLRFDTSGRVRRRHALAGRHALGERLQRPPPARACRARARSSPRRPTGAPPARRGDTARSMKRGTFALCATVGLLCVASFGAAPAPARVALVATGMPELALVDVGSDTVVARIALPAAARAVAVSADGRRGYVAAHNTIVALDVNERTEIARGTHGSGAISGLAIARNGRRLYAVQGRRLRIFQARTLRLLGSVDLRGSGRAIALRHDGRLAAVVLDARAGRDGVADAAAGCCGACGSRARSGSAITDGGRTLVSARGRLRSISPGARRARSRSIRLPRGAGGNLALSPGRTRLAVGARAGGAGGALVFVRSGHVRRLAAGAGPRDAGVADGLEPDPVRQPRRRRRCRSSARTRASAWTSCACPARRPRRSSCSRASRCCAGATATTCSTAPADPTASRGSRATTCCAAGATATCSTAAPATTA